MGFFQTDNSISPVLRWGGPVKFTSSSPHLTRAETGGQRGSDSSRGSTAWAALELGCGHALPDYRVPTLCIPCPDSSSLTLGSRLCEPENSGPSGRRHSAPRLLRGGPALCSLLAIVLQKIKSFRWAL